MKNTTLVLASGNQGKLKKMREFLAPLGLQVPSQNVWSASLE